MPDSIAALTSPWALQAVFTYIFLAQVGIPLPASPLLLVAGAIAVRDPVWGVKALLLATAASTLADSAWYLAGRSYGSRVLRLLCKLSLSPDTCVSETITRFRRWGRKAIVFAKFIPGASAIAPPLAGAMRMNVSTYVTLTILASALWASLYLALGALAAPAILQMLPVVARQGRTALLIALLLLALYILVKWLERRRLIVQLRGARVQAAELRTMMLNGLAPVILDVRTDTAVAFDPRTIPTAVHVPPDQVKTQLAGIARDEEVVLYCNCPNDVTAARIAKLLIDQGFRRVRPLQGGLDGWVWEGYPVERITVEALAPQDPLLSM